jgi:Kef-type K+ transport system membrane component KefB
VKYDSATAVRGGAYGLCGMSSRVPLCVVGAVAAVGLLCGATADVVSNVLLALVVVLSAAKLGGDIAMRLGQPPVLGELVAGVVVGNLSLVGVSQLAWIATDPTVEVLAELGVILLLFEVGLESTLAQMARVGRSAALVAGLGVAAPMLLGMGVGKLLLPTESFYVHLFLGAILTATSVGITARVLADLGASATQEARIILGAAVIDDVLGLVVLAAVSAVVTAADGVAAADGATADGGGSIGEIVWIVAKTLGFLVTAGLLGVYAVPRALRRLARLRGTGVMLGFSLAFCFALAWAAGAVGLAPIVGAFAAGLVLETAHYQPFHSRGERQLEELVHPIVQFLAPGFFVLMGFRVQLSAFADVRVLGLAAALIAAAVAGKQVCAFGVVDRQVRRLPVAIGMIPRGEVGLIFAAVGAKMEYHGEPLVNPAIFSATVIVVIVTTLITPPLLSWAIRPVLRVPPPQTEAPEAGG